MHSLYGWVRIRHDGLWQRYCNGEITGDEYDAREEELLKQIGWRFGFPETRRLQDTIHRGMNGFRCLLFSGGTFNHYEVSPTMVLEWMRDNCPGSYGLVYEHDDEDPETGDAFVVWRLAKGEITRHPDTLLSPLSEKLG